MSAAAYARNKSQKYKIKHREAVVKFNRENFAKETISYCSESGRILKTFVSGREAARYYKIDFKQLRNHIKSGLPIKRLNILVKYNL